MDTSRLVAWTLSVLPLAVEFPERLIKKSKQRPWAMKAIHDLGLQVKTALELKAYELQSILWILGPHLGWTCDST